MSNDHNLSNIKEYVSTLVSPKFDMIKKYIDNVKNQLIKKDEVLLSKIVANTQSGNQLDSKIQATDTKVESLEQTVVGHSDQFVKLNKKVYMDLIIPANDSSEQDVSSEFGNDVNLSTKIISLHIVDGEDGSLTENLLIEAPFTKVAYGIRNGKFIKVFNKTDAELTVKLLIR